jgi:uncharacterized tellurite resistance protein B-like protein
VFHIQLKPYKGIGFQDKECFLRILTFTFVALLFWVMENSAIVYLYLYLAIADKDFSKEELNLIVVKLKNNQAFQGMDTSAFIQEVYQNFLQLPFDAVIQYLENYMMSLDLSPEDRNKVVQDLEEIMEADGVIRKEELLAFQRIKKYLALRNPFPYRASA